MSVGIVGFSICWFDIFSRQHLGLTCQRVWTST